MSSGFRSLAVVVIIGLGYAGCGLPSIPFLAAPVNPDIETPTTLSPILSFQHNTENDQDDFRGYDLYYKIYADEDDAAIAADEQAIAATPQSPGPARLEQRGFVRAVVVTERDSSGQPFSITSDVFGDPLPHLPTSPTASSISYRLNLRDVPSDGVALDRQDLVMTWDQGSGQGRGLRRRSQGSGFSGGRTSALASFWDRAGYQSADWDVQRMNLSSAVSAGLPDRIVIVCYALAYGIDGTDFSGYYSTPLRLREAILEFP